MTDSKKVIKWFTWQLNHCLRDGDTCPHWSLVDPVSDGCKNIPFDIMTAVDIKRKCERLNKENEE